MAATNPAPVGVALSPPIKPMLARLVRDLPAGDYRYEPKWDGFRALVFGRDGEVDIRSRHDRPLSRYFPELVAGFSRLRQPFVIDGEIVLVAEHGFDFASLMLRLHPAASRVAELSRTHPASFVAFDLLAAGGDDTRDRPTDERFERLGGLLTDAIPPIFVTPWTDSLGLAQRWLNEFGGGGVDGVMAKAHDQPYQPGKRAMLKVKRLRTVDCVVAGARLSERSVASLLLGLYDGDRLRHVGVASNFSDAERSALFDEVWPLRTPLAGHPFEHGFGLERSPVGRLAGSAGRWDPDEMSLDWLPLRPELVCEVTYDTLDGMRFRHPARFLRWRPDRDARSCEMAQLRSEPAASLAETLRIPR